MQGIASAINEISAAARVAPAQTVAGANNAYQGYQILRRNGAVVSFEPSKIAVALMKAFLAVHGTQGAASASVRETVDGLTESVVRALLRSRPAGGTFHIEDIQDQVELQLMRAGEHKVARDYVLYREERAKERAAEALRHVGLYEERYRQIGTYSRDFSPAETEAFIRSEEKLWWPIVERIEAQK